MMTIELTESNSYVTSELLFSLHIPDVGLINLFFQDLDFPYLF